MELSENIVFGPHEKYNVVSLIIYYAKVFRGGVVDYEQEKME